MHPILFRYTILGYPRVVGGYGLMMVLGILIGLATTLLLARRRGLDVVDTGLVALTSIGAGLVGAYLLYLVTMLPLALSHPEVLLSGGLVFYGGPLVAVPAAWFASRKLGLHPLRVADVAAPALAIGHALGRMGCFLGGCCYGAKWDGPLRVVFTDPIAPASTPPMPRHPVQLYESAFLILLALALQLLWTRTRGHGRVALLYVLAYASWRLAIENLRSDAIRGFVIPGLLSTSQFVSLLLIPAALLGYWLLRRSSPARKGGDIA